jgi:hypothetical protein
VIGGSAGRKLDGESEFGAYSLSDSGSALHFDIGFRTTFYTASWPKCASFLDLSTSNTLLYLK